MSLNSSESIVTYIKYPCITSLSITEDIDFSKASLLDNKVSIKLFSSNSFKPSILIKSDFNVSQSLFSAIQLEQDDMLILPSKEQHDLYTISQKKVQINL